MVRRAKKADLGLKPTSSSSVFIQYPEDSKRSFFHFWNYSIWFFRAASKRNYNTMFLKDLWGLFWLRERSLEALFSAGKSPGGRLDVIAQDIPDLLVSTAGNSSLFSGKVNSGQLSQGLVPGGCRRAICSSRRDLTPAASLEFTVGPVVILGGS